MAKKPPRRESPADDLGAVADRLHPPVAVVLGSPRHAADLAFGIDGDVVCYQMDLHQGQRLREELAEAGSPARVVTAPDLWDLPGDFRTVLYPAPRGGERSLKIDMIEQAFHVLQPHGNLIVLSDYPGDEFFPGQLKKVYGRVHNPAAGGGRVFWCQRQDERPRRRHEITFQARAGESGSLRFLSRPGVFSYGRFDDGARALLDVAQVRPGDRVLDAGCGCGTNGIVAGLRSGAEGHVTFVDSNVRAVALAEYNARANGLTSFQAVASTELAGVRPGSCVVVLANPPYYAQGTIAQMFIERARPLLRPGGRLYLVTKQPDALGPLVADVFGRADVDERRGYTVLTGSVPS